MMPSPQLCSMVHMEGVFHGWGLARGFGDNSHTVAIVETEDGQVWAPLPERVKFINEPDTKTVQTVHGELVLNLDNAKKQR